MLSPLQVPRSHFDNLFLAFRSDPIWSPLLTQQVKLVRDTNPRLPKNESGNLSSIYMAVARLLKAGFRYSFPDDDPTCDPVLETGGVINLRSYGKLLHAIEKNPTGEWIVVPNDL